MFVGKFTFLASKSVKREKRDFFPIFFPFFLLNLLNFGATAISLLVHFTPRKFIGEKLNVESRAEWWAKFWRDRGLETERHLAHTLSFTFFAEIKKANINLLSVNWRIYNLRRRGDAAVYNFSRFISKNPWWTANTSSRWYPDSGGVREEESNFIPTRVCERGFGGYFGPF